jgi:hypothetical protein
MKKLIAIFAVLLLAAPAMAADWEFYGSQRVNTFYLYNDYGDGTAVDRFGVGSAGSGKDDDWGLIWDFQPGSRFGTKVKADKVKGQIELGLNMSSSNGGNNFNGTSGGDGTVSARRAWGEWKFAENASLKIGKDYTPVSNLISGKVFNDDEGLLGNGDFYGGRPGQVALTLGGFEIAFATNPLATTGFTAAQLAGTDIDYNIPKIEARYTLKLDNFEIAPFGGFNYFKVDAGNSTAITDDLDIYSYIGGLNIKGAIGAFYFAVQGAYGQNWRNARWASGYNPQSGQAASASLDTNAAGQGDDVNDSKSWMAGGLVGLKFTDTLKFEVGGGYRNDDPDISGADDVAGWMAYGQVVVTMAPGVYLVPEAGYYDFGDQASGTNNDNGWSWYAGMKWQIDF